MLPLRKRGWLLVLVALFAAPTLVWSDPPADDPPKKKRDPSALTPEQRQRARYFRSLPPEQQEKLRKLDRDFHNLDAKKQERLRQVMQRYQAWLERLPEADRKRIEGAANPEERLQIVQEIRDRQWMERLPKAEADDLAKLPPSQRTKKIRELREKERLARQGWENKLRPRPAPGKFTRFSELPPHFQNFVTKDLYPLLDDAEKKRLQEEEGKATYAKTLHDLVHKHHHRLRPKLREQAKQLLNYNPEK